MFIFIYFLFHTFLSVVYRYYVIILHGHKETQAAHTHIHRQDEREREREEEIARRMCALRSLCDGGISTFI